MRPRKDWSVSNFSVTKSSYVEKWKKDFFLNLRQLTNLLWQWCAMWRKLNLSCTYCKSPEGQDSCNSLAKNYCVRATFWEFGVMRDRVRRNTKTSRKCCIIYLKSKHSYKHCIYNKSWLNNKTEKIWHLFVCALISLLLLTFFTIVYAYYFRKESCVDCTEVKRDALR